MQAVAILLVASTMGGEFPTNPNANTLRLPPPMVRSSAPTKARSLLDEAMRATDSAASDAAASARSGANYLKNKVRNGVNGVSLAAGELRLDAPTSRVAQAQYQRDGLPLRPVDGMTGPGSRAAGSDPTAAYGGRMQSVPRSGTTMPAAPSLAPLPTTANRTAATPDYRPVRGYGAEANNTTSNTNPNGTAMQPPYRPTQVPRTQNTLPVAAPQVDRTYNPLANNNNSSLLDLPTTPRAATPANSGLQYRPNTNVNAPLEQPRTQPAPAVVPPLGGLATQPTVPTTTYRAPATTRTNTVSTDQTPRTNTLNNNRTFGTNNTRESEGSYIMTLLALFASVGLNIYLAWTAYDTYNRYQDLVADMKTTGPRRERRRERRRFVEPAASTASY